MQLVDVLANALRATKKSAIATDSRDGHATRAAACTCVREYAAAAAATFCADAAAAASLAASSGGDGTAASQSGGASAAAAASAVATRKAASAGLTRLMPAVVGALSAVRDALDGAGPDAAAALQHTATEAFAALAACVMHHGTTVRQKLSHMEAEAYRWLDADSAEARAAAVRCVCLVQAVWTEGKARDGRSAGGGTGAAQEGKDRAGTFLRRAVNTAHLAVDVAVPGGGEAGAGVLASDVLPLPTVACDAALIVRRLDVLVDCVVGLLHAPVGAAAAGVEGPTDVPVSDMIALSERVLSLEPLRLRRHAASVSVDGYTLSPVVFNATLPELHARALKLVNAVVVALGSRCVLFALRLQRLLEAVLRRTLGARLRRRGAASASGATASVLWNGGRTAVLALETCARLCDGLGSGSAGVMGDFLLPLLTAAIKSATQVPEAVVTLAGRLSAPRARGARRKRQQSSTQHVPKAKRRNTGGAGAGAGGSGDADADDGSDNEASESVVAAQRSWLPLEGAVIVAACDAVAQLVLAAGSLLSAESRVAVEEQVCGALQQLHGSLGAAVATDAGARLLAAAAGGAAAAMSTGSVTGKDSSRVSGGAVAKTAHMRTAWALAAASVARCGNRAGPPPMPASFSSPAVREALYRTLHACAVAPAPSGAHSPALVVAPALLRAGMSDPDRGVVRACSLALCCVEAVMHPRAPPLWLAEPRQVSVPGTAAVAAGNDEGALLVVHDDAQSSDDDGDDALDASAGTNGGTTAPSTAKDATMEATRPPQAAVAPQVAEAPTPEPHTAATSPAASEDAAAAVDAVAADDVGQLGADDARRGSAGEQQTDAAQVGTASAGAPEGDSTPADGRDEADDLAVAERARDEAKAAATPALRGDAGMESDDDDDDLPPLVDEDPDE